MLALFPFFSNKRTEEEQRIVLFVFKRFGYKLKNPKFFIRALTHKSLSNNTDEDSNERLEFLGDAILDAVIAEMLFDRYPNEDEGYLTKIKSKLVSRRTLGQIGLEMEIESVLRYNRGRTVKIETLTGNAFEALIGAIYLDGGIKAVKASINGHVLKKYVDLNTILQEEIDFKSKLFIWSQKNRLPIAFEVIKEENLGATWNYCVQVMINEKEFGLGFGSSKKLAEQAAAKETLELLGAV